MASGLKVKGICTTILCGTQEHAKGAFQDFRKPLLLLSVRSTEVQASAYVVAVMLTNKNQHA